MWEAAAIDAAGARAAAPLVHALVQIEAAAVAEALAAFAADIERLASVGTSVHAQLSCSSAALAAVLAAEAAVAAVCALVPQQH